MNAPLAVFVHGAGSAGPEAWPRQFDDDRLRGSVFVTRPGFGSAEEPRETDWGAERDVVLDAVGVGTHVVGFSFGGLAALLAAAEAPGRIRSLCLLEPAAFSLARGDVAVEAHIAAVAPVLARRHELGASEFHLALMDAFGIDGVEPPMGEKELVSAERMRLTAAPWDAPVTVDVVAAIPTLVMTGGWNPEYDATAAALARAGASHVEVPGAGHRIQDHPRFTELLLSFWEQHP